MNTRNKKYKQLVEIKEKLEVILRGFARKRKKNSTQNVIAANATKPLIENALLAINKIINSKPKQKQVKSLLESVIVRTQVMMERLLDLREKYQKGSQVFEDLRITIVVIHHTLLEMLPKGYTIQLCLLTPEEYIDENYQEPVLETVKKTLDYWCAVINTCWETVKGVVRKLFKTRWDIALEKIKASLQIRGFQGEQLVLGF